MSDAALWEGACAWRRSAARGPAPSMETGEEATRRAALSRTGANNFSRARRTISKTGAWTYPKPRCKGKSVTLLAGRVAAGTAAGFIFGFRDSLTAADLSRRP